jgi:RNA-splicing ligase RtcB
MTQYLNDAHTATTFASLNRRVIANNILHKFLYLKLASYDFFETVHNYIDSYDKMLRKGAVSAHKDEKLLIPINMRDGSLICIGKGNEDWNLSAPHGAGRIMSRGKAKENVILADFEKEMVGIFSTSVKESTIDEAPMVYKPMEEIIANISDTVEIVDRIIPVYNFKA